METLRVLFYYSSNLTFCPNVNYKDLIKVKMQRHNDAGIYLVCEKKAGNVTALSRADVQNKTIHKIELTFYSLL